MAEHVEGSDAFDFVLAKMAARKPASTQKAIPLPKALPSTAPKKDMAATKKDELELWQQWKDNGHKPEHLNPLLKSLTPVIESHSRLYKNRVEIPTAAIDFEYKQQVVDALKTYDPTKGTQLTTWVTGRLRKAGRFVKTNQNFARITEPIAYKIGKFNTAKDNLKESMGFEPDDITLAEHTGFSMKEIKRLRKDQRKGLVASGAAGSDMLAAAHTSSRENEVINLIYHQLSPQERVVHEYTFGLNGKPALKSGQIAKQTGMDPSKVSKLRTSILNQIREHL